MLQQYRLQIRDKRVQTIINDRNRRERKERGKRVPKSETLENLVLIADQHLSELAKIVASNQVQTGDN